MHRIFLLPELLMEIISFLPPTDLRTCASVSRHWKETLRLNLHPRNFPLPDTVCNDPSTPRPYILKKLPQSISSLAQDIVHRTTLWQNAGVVLDISDDYYFWHEGAYSNLLSTLSQYLHPWLGKHVCEFVGGLEEIARGDMGICVRTKLGAEKLDEWFREGEREVGRERSVIDAYLSKPVTRKVEVYCVEGATWDQEYVNVLQRGARKEWQQRCVKIERRNGIRLGDVVDELRGMLKPNEVVTEFGRDVQKEVLLEWRFDDAAIRMMCFEWLDSTG